MTSPPKARRYNAATRSAPTSHTDAAPPSSSQDADAVALPPAPAQPRVRVLRGEAQTPGQPAGTGATAAAEGASGGGNPGRLAGDGQASEASDAFARLTASPDEVEDGFGGRRFATAGGPEPKHAGQSGTGAAAAPATGAALTAALAAIRAEGLTERQLRIARRIAALHQVAVASDEEAVLRLREQGIDPSQRAAVGRILASAGAEAQARPASNAPVLLTPAKPPAAGGVGALQPAPPPAALPSREVLAEGRRAAEIMAIQRDLARRRRRRMLALAVRLTVLVLLPTALAGWYYFRVATPLYATVSQFQIQTADGMPGVPPSPLTGMGMATNTDAVAVQSYLTSRDAMLRLDADLGFTAAFRDPSVDPVQRLAPDSTNEEAYKVYRRSVKIGYDPTEGVINMEVSAPDPALSERFSLALIGYAEGQVDQMTARLRSDQMDGAAANYADAERKVAEAQDRVQALQEEMGVLDATAEGGLVMSQIGSLETQLTEKELALAQYRDNARPNRARVEALTAEIGRLRARVAETRTQLTQSRQGRASLAAIGGQLRIAEGELTTRQALLATAAQAMEEARIEANKQVRYLSLSIRPVPPDEPSYPRAAQNTMVAFLICAGVYLMLSLTASILREQVST